MFFIKSLTYLSRITILALMKFGFVRTSIDLPGTCTAVCTRPARAALPPPGGRRGGLGLVPEVALALAACVDPV